MAYIFCDSCGIGFHSNVFTCPECGRPATSGFVPTGRAKHTRARSGQPREDVEDEVREAIYGWRSGTVELHRDAAVRTPAIAEPLAAESAAPSAATRRRDRARLAPASPA